MRKPKTHEGISGDTAQAASTASHTSSISDFSTHSVTLTPIEMDALQQVSQDITDSLGRSISVSAVVRALIRQLAKRGSWATDTLLLEIEEERQTDVMWEKKKK
jgi:L-aminopeptidase/D-esterase-like protein